MVFYQQGVMSLAEFESEQVGREKRRPGTIGPCVRSSGREMVVGIRRFL